MWHLGDDGGLGEVSLSGVARAGVWLQQAGERVGNENSGSWYGLLF